MPREKFEITVFAPPQKDDRGIETLRNRVDHFIPLPADLAVARRNIESRRLDVLCYLDIGMDPLTYFLAYSRLAPVQCTTWGHPETSGIDTIDYYLSSRDFEPDNGDTHYSERMVRLAHPPAVIARPAVPTAATPGHFGLGDDRHVYLCPQSLFKIHPDMDELFAALLRRDARAVVVLCDGPFRRWSELLGARFARAIPDVADRIRFLPRQGYEDYLRLLACVDVVLDTLHFGGGITSYEALAVGTPIVTLPGEFMRGRSTAGCYRRMGYTDWVAADRDDYIERALALGGDAGLREQARRHILAANDVLYANTAVAQDMGRFFQEALAAAHPVG